ncbi:MAG: hypothetical protein Q9205_005000 [Flavoplaca limonia]
MQKTWSSLAVKHSREAPFGKGDQKLVDPSVRKTWEIDPAQVQFCNPQWSKTVQYAVNKTIEQLGVLGGESSVRAELHKLLLFEEGGFFKTHRDTEKAPGMFATLVIMLPSDYQGGEVVVRLGKEKHQLSNPDSNEFSYAFLACLKTGDWTDVLLQQLDDGMKADSAKNELLNVCSLILNRLAAAISALPRLGTRLGTIKLFEDEYRKALALHAKPDSTPEEKLRKQDRVAGCMSDALLRKPNEGDLQVGDGDNEFLLLRARSQGNPFVLEVVLPICKLAIRSMDFVTDTVLNLAQDIDDNRLSHSTMQELIRDIVIALAQEISQHCGSKSMKDSKTDHFQPGKIEVSTYALHTASAVSYNPDLYKTQMSWKAITKLLCLCEKLGTMNCVPVLIRPLIEIAHAPGKIDLTEFLMPLISSLAQELPEILASPSHYHNLFQQVIYHYILDRVGQKPAPPQSLVRGGNKDKCYASGGFRSNSSECSYTDKSHGTPYTLVVSKTDRSYREALNAWERRCAKAKSHIEGIGREKLKMFQGEQYDKIMEQLSHVTLGKTISTDRQPLVPMSTSTQNTKRAYDGVDDGVEDGPARKRATQVEIIDLC